MLNSRIIPLIASFLLSSQANAAVDYITLTTPDLSEFTQVTSVPQENLTLVGRGFRNPSDEVFALACVGKPIDSNQAARDCHWLRFVYHTDGRNFYIANPFPVSTGGLNPQVSGEDLRSTAVSIMSSVREYSYTKPAKFNRQDIGITLGYGSMIAGGYLMISDYRQNASVSTQRFLTGAALGLIGPAIWMFITNGALRASLVSPVGIFDPLQNQSGWNWQISPRKIPKYRFDLFKAYLKQLAIDEVKDAPGKHLESMPW